VTAAEFRRRALEVHLLTQAAPQSEKLAPPAQAELEAIEVLHTIYAAYESRCGRRGGWTSTT